MAQFAAAQPAPDTPAIPTAPLIVSPTDYPTASLLANEKGTLSLFLVVGADGNVADALLGASSGFPRLDAKALEVAKTRWRFTPAIHAGHAISDSMKVEVVWALPLESAEGYLFPDETDMPAGAFLAGGTPPQDVPGANLLTANDMKQIGAGEQGEVITKVLIGADGSVKNVRIADGSGFTALDDAVVKAIRGHFKYVPGMVTGKPAQMWMTVRSSVPRTPDAGAPRFCHLLPFVERAARRGPEAENSAVEVQPWFRIDTDGKIAEVMVLTDGGWMLWSQPLVDEANTQVRFPPPKMPANTKVCWVDIPLAATVTAK